MQMLKNIPDDNIKKFVKIKDGNVSSGPLFRPHKRLEVAPKTGYMCINNPYFFLIKRQTSIQ